MPGPAASASPGNLSEMQVLRHHSTPAESEILEVGPSSLCSNKPSRWLFYSEENLWVYPPSIAATSDLCGTSLSKLYCGMREETSHRRVGKNLSVCEEKRPILIRKASRDTRLQYSPFPLYCLEYSALKKNYREYHLQ